MKQNSMHFFVAITVLSLFILSLFFLEKGKKIERGKGGNNDKKNAQSSVSSMQYLNDWKMLPISS